MSNITYRERETLEWLVKTSLSIRAIARYMNRDHSIISRELRRNGDGRKKYKAEVAQRRVERRKIKKRVCKLEKYILLQEYVENMIQIDWSPEQISGVLRSSNAPKELQGIYVSHETIYQWIFYRSDVYKELYKHLRTFRKKRYKHGKRKSRGITIQKRVSIHKRPLVVAQRARYGDWETDSMIFSKGKACLSVQYERKSMLVRICKIENKSANETLRAIRQCIDSLPQYCFNTITFDNGTEGAYHYKLSYDYPGLKMYFCDPYASWQKGGVENMNKLIRQYLPRSTNLHQLSDENLYQIQETLNNRPRKGLNYKSPNQIFQKMVLA